MTKPLAYFIALFAISIGCATGKQEIESHDVSSSSQEVAGDTTSVQQVDFEGPVSTELIQPSMVEKAKKVEAIAPQPLPTTGLDLQSLQEMALANNPAIAQSAARVRALRGKWEQVGLPPNPTVGYVAGEIGNEGAAGQQGGFIGQDFITAKKLQRNRAVVAAEIGRAEQELALMQRKVQTDVRQSYYGALLAQRRVELADDLVRVMSEAVVASKALVEAEEIPLAGLLQSEIQQKNAEVLLRTAQNGLSQSWRRLSAIVAGPEFPIQHLEGDVSELPQLLDWQEQLARVQCESPEVAAAMAEVERARRALNRACVEAVPDISTQLSAQYDDSTNDTIAGVPVSYTHLTLPTKRIV